MRIRLVAVAGASVIALVLLVVLLVPRHQLAASNSRVLSSAASLPVPPGTQRCQGGEDVPADSASLRVYPGGMRPGGPPLVISVFDRSARQIARVSVPGGYPVAVSGLSEGQPLDVALPSGRPDVELGRLCIRNTGRTPVALAGNLRSLNPAAPGAVNGPGQRGSDEVRVDYYLPGTPTYLDMAGRIMKRAALFRPGFMGPWTIWLVLALFVVTCGTGLVWIVRHLESQE